MSKGRELFQSDAEQERDKELNRALAVSRKDLADKLDEIKAGQAGQRELLESILTELRRINGGAV